MTALATDLSRTAPVRDRRPPDRPPPSRRQGVSRLASGPPGQIDPITLEYDLIDLLFWRDNGRKQKRVDAIFRSTRRRVGINPDKPDCLLELLGFDRETMPDMSYHEFVSAMGLLFEDIVKLLFSLARPRLFRDDWGTILSKHYTPEELEARKSDKLKADFALGYLAIEVKYRMGAKDALPRQKKAYGPLTDMGFKPVALMLRKSPNADEMRKAGWDVHEGDAALQFIEDHTGIDLVRFLARLRRNPLFRNQLAPYLRLRDERSRAQLTSDYLHVRPEERRALHLLTLTNAALRAEFLDEIGATDHPASQQIAELLDDLGETLAASDDSPLFAGLEIIRCQEQAVQ